MGWVPDLKCTLVYTYIYQIYTHILQNIFITNLDRIQPIRWDWTHAGWCGCRQIQQIRKTCYLWICKINSLPPTPKEHVSEKQLLLVTTPWDARLPRRGFSAAPLSMYKSVCGAGEGGIIWFSLNNSQVSPMGENFYQVYIFSSIEVHDKNTSTP